MGSVQEVNKERVFEMEVLGEVEEAESPTIFH
ncbi:hypothetical protein Pint_10018 [Pistacia integerrima]|uniref:Uncharacterized protein n=2 Tax=Pistacia TaxID=55512 RepID=A0ACC1A6E0_9ROSI|nr:hypothetical protein Pint_10018 [Pistacia integerrima]KAJ0083074.1 hypothetical protein Patl1_10169 [Pistacia atlantica]